MRIRHGVLCAIIAMIAALLAPAEAHAGAAAPPARIASASIAPSTRTPVAGSWIRFTGTAPRSWRGDRVTIQHKGKRDAAWAAVGSTTVASDGAIRFRQRAVGRGSEFYRLVNGGGTSNTVTVVVHRWYYLADLENIETEIEGRPGGCTGGCTGFHDDSILIGGRRYTRSWVMRIDDDGDRSTSTWNASRKCRTFDATVGLTDDSGTTTGLFTINLGGDDIVLANAPTGTGTRVSTDVRGIFRFVIAASNQGPGENADSGWGNARLLCRGRP